MVPNITIRQAAESDVPAIQRVARASWQEAYGEFVPGDVIDEMLAYGYSVGFLEEALAGATITIFVAEDEQSVVGYVSCELPTEGETGQVSIYVAPDDWGEGIGTRLLTRAEEHLDAGGATTLRDVVLAANDVGNTFYRKHFDRTDETTVEMGGEEFDANVYTATL